MRGIFFSYNATTEARTTRVSFEWNRIENVKSD
jgi:hypothetical protein